MHPISIRNNLIKDLQSIQTIKIIEKPTNLKEITKKVQKSSRNSLDLNAYTPESVKLKLKNIIKENPQISNKKFDRLKIINEFENLDNKLETVNQKIEKEIRRQSNSLEKGQNPSIMYNINNVFVQEKQENDKSLVQKKNYNSFSCISENFHNKDEESESEKMEINNTFQIENIDYERFKTSLDKQIEDENQNEQEDQCPNINFEQISELSEIPEY